MTDSKSDVKKYDFDKLKMYFGDDFKINDKISIKQPAIGKILDAGESDIYSVVNVFVANTTMYRLQLWDMGEDWNKISDFKLFSTLIKGLSKERTEFLFGDIEFDKFRPCNLTFPDGEERFVIYNQEQDILIDEDTYLLIREYIRTMFNIFPKDEFAKGKTTKKWIIEEERMNLEKAKKEGSNSILLPMLSTCINHPGFKYKLQELREVGIVQFMDSVKRLQVYESSTALLKGMYSGFVDTSKIDKSEFDFMRDLSKN